ncbi:MAG: SDR family oxidoreductase [Geminicoccaceae bacterium]
MAIDLGLDGARVLVTGASSGIGAAVAALLAAAGARLVLHGHANAAGLDGVASATDAIAVFREDFADRDAVRWTVGRAVEALGGLDVLINNAGHMLGRVPLAEADDAAIDRIVELNAMSVVVASRTALPALSASRGCIVSTSSISARSGGSAGSSLYAAAKGFVSTFTRSLATELAPKGIRVNAVSPGTIMTPFHERYSTPEKLEATRQRIPLQRLGSGDDCAGAFLFLASPVLAGYITGQVIEVNGGQLMP